MADSTASETRSQVVSLARNPLVSFLRNQVVSLARNQVVNITGISNRDKDLALKSPFVTDFLTKPLSMEKLHNYLREIAATFVNRGLCPALK